MTSSQTVPEGIRGILLFYGTLKYLEGEHRGWTNNLTVFKKIFFNAQRS